jgi:hypothetical protein
MDYGANAADIVRLPHAAYFQEFSVDHFLSCEMNCCRASPG